MSRVHEQRSGISTTGEGAGGQIRLPFIDERRRRSEHPAPEGRAHVIAGLFAGVGGLERGLHRAGHRTSVLCENDPIAIEVLRARFPNVPLHHDVCTLEDVSAETSLIVAGFPCQDLSQAGSTRGIAGARSGLVGEVFRLIESHRTPWVLLENVPFMLQLACGEAMNVITSAFEEIGYKWAYRVVDTRAFGLPQRRRRVYLVASSEGDPRSILFADEANPVSEPIAKGNSIACGFYWTEGLRGLGWAVDAVPTLKGGSAIGIPSPPAILLSDGRLVTPHIRDAERLQGFPAGWTKPAERVAKAGARWKLVGNAVSVPAAAWIGRRLRRPGRVLAFDVAPMRGHRHWPVAAWNIGEGRVSVEASEWPVARRYRSLESFLAHEPSPLSAKATAGFLERANRAQLRFQPGFIDAVTAHLNRMRPTAPAHGIAFKNSETAQAA